MRIPLLLLALAPTLSAATMIEIDARFADVPAGTEIPATAAKLDQIKGIDVLSAPRLLATPGKAAEISVTQETLVPGAAAVPLGVSLSITPTLGEKTIHFTGKATDRASHGKRSAGGVNTVEFATRELYFEGTTTSGGVVLLQSAPMVTKVIKDEKTTTQQRELVIYLTFTKKVSDDPADGKPVPAKQPAPKPTGPSKKKH